MGSMGGMGGMGGLGGGTRSRRPGTSNHFGDEDEDMGGYTFTSGGMPGGMPRPGSHSTYSGAQRPPSPAQSPEITRPLKVSLHDLYTGAMKRLKVGRRLASGSTEEKVLEIQIHPGWKSGTKIRFPKAGNELANGDSQDLIFVVEEKPDDTFSREGNDLVAQMSVDLVEALTGSPPLTPSSPKTATHVLEMLDGRKLRVPLPVGVVKPGAETRIPGEGMPIRKEGHAKKKGDLVVKWSVVFPNIITAKQKEELRRILN